MKLSNEVKTDIRDFINMELSDWKKDAKEYGAMDITFATNNSGNLWNYQTGDNSYTGGCYSLPHWAVSYIDSDTTVTSLYDEIISQLTELLPENR